MNEYIRTKYGIFEVEQIVLIPSISIFAEGIEYNVKNIETPIPEEMVINISNNVEELIDEYVLFYRETKGKLIPWATYERNDENWENNKKDLIRELNNKYREAEVFGAIWTPRGLIYVGKMDIYGKTLLYGNHNGK